MSPAIPPDAPVSFAESLAGASLSLGYQKDPAMRTLDSFIKCPDDPYYQYEYKGCAYGDPTDLIQGGLLGMCCCGNPEANLQYVLGGLELLVDFGYHNDELVLAHFGAQEAANFFWYWVTEKDFAEHGGSVPGWLTPEGWELLELLREWETSPEEE